MIKILVEKDTEQNIVGFRCQGHAGYAKAGKDIVCAAVSVLVMNTINAIEAFTSDKFTYHEEEESGTILFHMDCPCEKSSLLLKTLVLGLSSIEEDYGKKYITVEFVMI